MPYRDDTVKGIRAVAHKEQISFKSAIDASDLPNWKKPSVTPGFKYSKTRDNSTNGGEADAYINRRGRLMKGKDVCLDDGADDHYYPEDFDNHPGRSTSLTFADVETKVAKPKGVRKEYDWIDSVAPVLVLDDDDLRSVFSEEEWEDIYAEQQAMLNKFQKPYSAAATSTGG